MVWKTRTSTAALAVAGCVLASAAPAAGQSAGPGQAGESVFVPCTPDRAAALNAAIVAANGSPGTRAGIVLQGGCTYTLTAPFDGVNGLTAVTGDVRISSRGRADATIARGEAPGTADFRVLEVEVGGRLALDRITVRNGRSIGSGAGIFNNFGTLSLHRSTLADNHAKEFGGGLFNNGERATATLRDSTVRDGSADFAGGALFNNGAKAKLTGTRVVSNRAVQGVGGGILNNGSISVLALESSTVTGNAASSTAGGILNGGRVTTRDAKITRNRPNNCAGSARPVPGCAD